MNFDAVGEEGSVDGLGGVRHEAAAAEGRLLEEPGEGAGVVEVEVRHEQQVELLAVDDVKEGQRVLAVQARVVTKFSEFMNEI
mgnify:CR=1 FL=1